MKKIITTLVLLLLISACSSNNVKKEDDKIEPVKTQKEIRVNEILDKMTLKEKIGQLFIVRMPVENAIEDAKKYHLGGMVIFSDNLENKTLDSLTKSNKALQKELDIPMLIGIDEEGGTVSRLSYSKLVEKAFKSPQTLYKENGMKAIKEDTIAKSQLLKSVGINLNLAPVVDVATDSDAFIYDRTIGLNAKKTSEYAKVVVETMKENQMGSTLKHFPGYGNNKDSHVEIVTDSKKLKTFRKSDFLPFIAGINAQADSILVSHNIVNAIDSTQPASISSKVHDILRNELNFDKVIMTDDLDMAGIAEFVSQEKAALKAIQAGNDMVMTSHYKQQIPYIIKAIEKEEISIDQIDQSVTRVLNMKYDLNLIK
ncbi:glycoside hydrolase family 3 N-terminal domain-containing protein [Mycoplasma sp. P36-A1]|uniref:glycoside hydrolase family 3 N-terminal domain-containing protein n=1 Tax=Mycoplasma sp. P36-A1 TaxID=3252900 RepID=UPI003C2F6C72